jgi:subfamily B ATP-binding cassette protein HlyB/CyaB
MIDGVDLAMTDPAWLRRQIGVVLQENLLFNRSVRENIALADPGMPLERVIEAATLAGAHDFILQLPEGYDTVVGERGGSLSGGQRQRIAIARALILQPQVLVLDEPTSALDVTVQAEILRLLRSLQERTNVAYLFISHDLAVIRALSHRILVLKDGKVVEMGTAAEVLGAPRAGYTRALMEAAGV